MNTAALDRPLGFESDEESVHALTAKLLGLEAVHSEVDLIERLEKGLTIATAHSLRLRAHLTDAETYQLSSPRRTLNRSEVSGQMLTSVEADKAVRVARVTARAQQVFAGLPAYAAARIRLIRDCVRKRDYFNPICHVRADEHLRLRTIGLAIGRISPANQTAT